MLDYALLSALAAVINTGSFDKAAVLLGVTPSAVSQRIKLLEERVGTLLVIRGQPCEATPAGARLRRHVDEVALLEDLVRSDLGGMAEPYRRATIRIAVNDDSLATWFPQAMAASPDCLYDLLLDDEAYTLDWLKRGDVVAAVSTLPGPVQGCNTLSLGRMRYLATASPAFHSTWFADGVTAESLLRAPCIAFNTKDSAHLRWIESRTGGRSSPPTHYLSSSEAILRASLSSLGWALNPAPLAAQWIANGKLVPLSAPAEHHVDLYWHWSRLVAPALSSLKMAVTTAARQVLV